MGPSPKSSLKSVQKVSVSTPIKQSRNKGTQGVWARYDTELPPSISIVRHWLGCSLRYWASDFRLGCEMKLQDFCWVAGGESGSPELLDTVLWPAISPTDPQTPKNSKTQKSYSQKLLSGSPAKVTQKLLKSDSKVTKTVQKVTFESLLSNFGGHFGLGARK